MKFEQIEILQLFKQEHYSNEFWFVCVCVCHFDIYFKAFLIPYKIYKYP